jgi:hypothetical protein
MVLRFRRSAGIERQQVKWVVAGVVFVAATFTFSTILLIAGGPDYSGVTFVVSVALFATVMGVAILRYRLYDVDVVIRKTARLHLLGRRRRAGLPWRDHHSGRGLSLRDRPIRRPRRDSPRSLWPSASSRCAAVSSIRSTTASRAAHTTLKPRWRVHRPPA